MLPPKLTPPEFSLRRHCEEPGEMLATKQSPCPGLRRGDGGYFPSTSIAA